VAAVQRGAEARKIFLPGYISSLAALILLVFCSFDAWAELPPELSGEQLLSGSPQSAEPATGWRWRRAGPAEYAGILIGSAGALYNEAAYGSPGKPRWSARNSFDQGVRDSLRLKHASARNAADTVGDALMWTLIAEPVVDTFVTLGWRDHRWDELFQTSVINLDSFLFTSLVSSVMQTTIKRQKPYLQGCPDGSCADSQANRSMPSGHTAFAFTGAGLFCTNHSFQSLYADPALERDLCAASLIVATAEGVTRVMADRHYATDVIAGSAIGLFSGFALPRLLHYLWPAEGSGGGGSRVEREEPPLGKVSFTPQLYSGGGGLSCDVRF
jgi:membrane-associated phospholipid phosphatase